MKLRAQTTVSSEEVGEGLEEGTPGNDGEGQNSEEAMEGKQEIQVILGN